VNQGRITIIATNSYKSTMKTHADVVVIGGGVIGCSVLYHLTKLGCKDIVLCERKELTAGSSWHAAGGFHALNSDSAMARLQSYTISLYRELEEMSGQDVGLHFTGGLNVAGSKERWDLLVADASRHRVVGLSTELISPSEVRKLCPLIDTSDIYGALYDPKEGHLDPSGATHAYAKVARNQGAEIYRHTSVLAIEQIQNGVWRVITDKGAIETQHVVNAAGLWAREVGHMVGVRLPLIPMEHHYLLTEDIPELLTLPGEIPLILDLDAEIYLRQERKSILLGVYERDATPWAVSGTPWDYGSNELLSPQLERLTDALEKGFARFPSLSNAGIRRVVNGPFTFTPDGNPLVGPVPGLRNYWAACGVMAGFAQGGGVGLTLAQWIVDGQPSGDVYAMDVARFGPYATQRYTIAKAREFYSRRFQIAYPNEHWAAGRPSKTSPLHEILAADNAVFGASYGLEIPLYFAQPDEEARERPALKRSNAFDNVRRECLASRGAVAITDIASFAKYELKGPGAANALDQLIASHLPEIGQVAVTPMLAPSGKLMGDLLTYALAPEHFMLTGSGYLQAFHMRWFEENLKANSFSISNQSDALGGIAVFGPHARDLLRQVTETDLSNAQFPHMSVRRVELGMARAWVARVSVTGELAYEIYVPSAHLAPLYRELRRIGKALGIQQAGMYALNSLRLEKGMGIWSRELSRDYTPQECGLAKFIAYEKKDFIGKSKALMDRDNPPQRKLVHLAVDAVDADPSGNDPIWLGDQLVGFVTSGGYGHCVDRSLAMGYVNGDALTHEEGLQISILGDRRTCSILSVAPVDPSGSRMRS
jgi:dimethylglycine dehydrogenase